LANHIPKPPAVPFADTHPITLIIANSFTLTDTFLFSVSFSNAHSDADSNGFASSRNS